MTSMSRKPSTAPTTIPTVRFSVSELCHLPGPWLFGRGVAAWLGRLEYSEVDVLRAWDGKAGGLLWAR
jgi:hypothetical protein